ncbi:hypothetical protein Q7C36_002895 [Tachysurus vachellii]|uniref:Uncharacterized protein n=1 Tax=Tachysurus vachellii TaxID=175792 RepID=A0AA88NSH7_TACVA|nr:hypothetical protein Q7C36_002876 [Tachysurus vachellii]KAK2863741.1 hypothetical protein Q7C36_002895 [Tachysurus vachellii]
MPEADVHDQPVGTGSKYTHTLCPKERIWPLRWLATNALPSLAPCALDHYHTAQDRRDNCPPFEISLSAALPTPPQLPLSVHLLRVLRRLREGPFWPNQPRGRGLLFLRFSPTCRSPYALHSRRRQERRSLHWLCGLPIRLLGRTPLQGVFRLNDCPLGTPCRLPRLV